MREQKFNLIKIESKTEMKCIKFCIHPKHYEWMHERFFHFRVTNYQKSRPIFSQTGLYLLPQTAG